MQWLGIDYGEKRIGLAAGDELGIAVPLPAAVEPAPEARMARIGAEIGRRGVTELVVGYPYNMDGTVSAKAREVDGFIAELERRFGLPVHRVDERLTSYAAEEHLKAAGRRPKRKDIRRHRRTGEVDSRAATLILQDFLDTRGP
ncbi:MAG: Holliday junction resolvase RuvX [Opitutales bacterium]|nr:Holliday junction resolvase RuvX [Opitutales bacterium]